MKTEYFARKAEVPKTRRLARRRRRHGSALLLFAVGVICGCVADRIAMAHDGRGETAPETEAPAVIYQMEVGNVPTVITLPEYVQEDLLPVNPYSRCGEKLTQVNAIVIHYVGNPNTTAWQNRSYFANLAETGETSASSNLIVGMEGETILCVPLDEVAYCSNDRNHDTISIEFCHPSEDGKPTQATYDALVKLTAWLCDTFSLKGDTDVIRHYDVIGKECPRYFVRNQEEWEQFKQDVTLAQK